MNYRLQLSPISGIRESQIESPSPKTSQDEIAVSWENASFFRSWLVYDSNLDSNERGINWNLLMGMTLCLAVSVAFWVGVGMIAARIWR